MRGEVIERRRAAVARLLTLQAEGRLRTATVRAAAESLGVSERSVWRWLAAGGYEPVALAGWRTTPAAIEALYRCGGRPTAAWRLLRDEGEAVPSRTVFCDALKRDLSPAERAYARLGEDGRRRYQVYRRSRLVMGWAQATRIRQHDLQSRQFRAIRLHKADYRALLRERCQPERPAFIRSLGPPATRSQTADRSCRPTGRSQRRSAGSRVG